MSEADGPLYKLPLDTYQPSVTYASYISTKQMIDQVLNEDQEYVMWKLRNRRLAGNMKDYLDEFKNEVEHFQSMEWHRKSQSPSSFKKNHNKVTKKQSWDLNRIPPNVVFARDIYERKIKSLPRPRELDETDLKKLFMSHLDDEQMNRYEVFKRTSLAKNQIKKISGVVTNQTVANNINLLLGGVGKIFVGEIVEKALDIKEKWLLGLVVNKFHERKRIGVSLKKHLKKLTRLVERSDSEDSFNDINDSVQESEPESADTDDEGEIKFMKTSNNLLQSQNNVESVRKGLIKQYNILVAKFNELDVSVEKYKDSPLLPEHVHEAWRLYRIENDTLPSGQYRTQGEANGLMFR
ncbi:TATA-binding protein-associated factor TAF11 [Kluyveromyces lactis]|uniref:KLLA0B01067p n=1 Tax=Kluyveromyces lactis (strain ATCC 8585 / CBS 2359 / DSM 70799 / NBRC 1267 / NRRL Y-1140 / WM37) TaxID=284590 RepID=Q6CWW1_KLULA|nr:uncharacterized protein KLLA0_B01067g [Kluyveromyces lactis]CAH01971.1 KLLA0B01067p [Kluyveromyces lactis]|eukprot:XP_451578.1 uncharacterized protein KLLA0_B01067g [Kluyveromyces lactis]